jgi:cytochrome P450
LPSAGAARQNPPYRPPAPRPLSPTLSLLRMAWTSPRSLLSLVPAAAYTEKVMRLGVTRRGILLVNDPVLVRQILTNPLEIYPKNDLMVGALEPLVGRSIFVSDGAAWRRQRAMVDPAFSHMGISRAFAAMSAAADEDVARLAGLAASGQAFSLDEAMSRLTADIICRTIFGRSLQDDIAVEVFRSFAVFERSVASVDIAALLVGKPWGHVRQPQHVLAACERIRALVGRMLDRRIADGGPEGGDIAGDLMAARDPETGEPFTREELIDQIGVMFLAGHETTASVLTWAFYILSQRPEIAARLRAEVEAVTAGGAVELGHVKKLEFTRDVFREALRLYPPITFIPRVAAEDAEIGGFRVRRGAMIMIAPWTMHRHKALWRDPDVFDPGRFSDPAQREAVTSAYLPFGMGPRICVGAAFAMIEAGLILARLVRAFDVEALAPSDVMPIARLTTRPAREIMIRVRAVA